MINLQNLMDSNTTLIELPKELNIEKEYKFAKLNKNDSIQEYEDLVYKKEDYNIFNCKFTHLWIMETYEALKILSTNLLTDFKQLKGLGGSDDNYTYVVGIVYNNKIVYVVDPQGHSYARYVGLNKIRRGV